MNDHAALWGMIFEYYKQAFSPNLLRMYVLDTEHISLDILTKAANEYRRNPKNRTCPLPAQLLELCEQKPNSAELHVGKIINAVSRFGWNNQRDARETMGEIAWATVQHFGGWQLLCESLTAESTGMLRAQLRGIAQALIDRPHLTIATDTVGLPGPENESLKIDFRELLGFNESSTK